MIKCVQTAVIIGDISRPNNYASCTRHRRQVVLLLYVWAFDSQPVTHNTTHLELNLKIFQRSIVCIYFYFILPFIVIIFSSSVFALLSLHKCTLGVFEHIKHQQQQQHTHTMFERSRYLANRCVKPFKTIGNRTQRIGRQFTMSVAIALTVRAAIVRRAYTQTHSTHTNSIKSKNINSSDNNNKQRKTKNNL